MREIRVRAPSHFFPSFVEHLLRPQLLECLIKGVFSGNLRVRSNDRIELFFSAANDSVYLFPVK